MPEIRVRHRLGEYMICAGENILEDTLNELAEKASHDRAFVVSDSNVFRLHGARLESALTAAGIAYCGRYIFEAGEGSKRLETVSRMYEAFAAAQLTRNSLVIAFGGGVCGDMAGFAAATWLRGVDVLQIPTSLLAQIDSSIGGKVGVDLEIGKNLVGAFHQPTAVIADSSFLATLPERRISDGMGEAIKYGCISDAELFSSIASRSIDRAELIYRCMKIKSEVVTSDENETGIRKILNYGHTIGHAVEKSGGYSRYTHGESVGIGMLYAAKLGERLGLPPLYDEIKAALEVWGLPTSFDYSPSELAKAAAGDKKRNGDSVTLILLEEIGKTVFREIPISRLEELLS